MYVLKSFFYHIRTLNCGISWLPTSFVTGNFEIKLLNRRIRQFGIISSAARPFEIHSLLTKP